MIGNDFDVPVMYQDLGTYSMNQSAGMMTPGMMPSMAPGMMPGMMPGAMSGTAAGGNSLGGVTMKPQLENDTLDLINKKHQEDKNTIKKVGLALGALLLIGFVPHFRKQITKSGGVGKYLKKQWKDVVDSFKNIGKPKPTKWQKFKGWISKPFKRKAKP